MQTQIPIISNTMDAKVLLAALNEYKVEDKQISFAITENDESSPISTRGLDPTIVVALIGLAGTTITNLVTLLVVLYKDKGKEGVVEIKVGDNALKYTGELTEKKKKEILALYNKLDEHNRIMTLPLPLPEDDEDEYKEILDQLLLEKVEYVKVLEDIFKSNTRIMTESESLMAKIREATSLSMLEGYRSEARSLYRRNIIDYGSYEILISFIGWRSNQM